MQRCQRPKKQQILNAVSVENGSHTTVLEWQQVTRLWGLKQPLFYSSQCFSTDRQQTSLPAPIRCYHCHSQTDSEKKPTIQCSQREQPFHLSRMKISKKQAASLPGWFCNTCHPIINPPHSLRTPIPSTHLHNPLWCSHLIWDPSTSPSPSLPTLFCFGT